MKEWLQEVYLYDTRTQTVYEIWYIRGKQCHNLAIKSFSQENKKDQDQDQDENQDPNVKSYGHSLPDGRAAAVVYTWVAQEIMTQLRTVLVQFRNAHTFTFNN